MKRQPKRTHATHLAIKNHCERLYDFLSERYKIGTVRFGRKNPIGNSTNGRYTFHYLKANGLIEQDGEYLVWNKNKTRPHRELYKQIEKAYYKQVPDSTKLPDFLLMECLLGFREPSEVVPVEPIAEAAPAIDKSKIIWVSEKTLDDTFNKYVNKIEELEDKINKTESIMNDTEKKEIAAAIKAKVEELNELIAQALPLGLRVSTSDRRLYNPDSFTLILTLYEKSIYFTNSPHLCHEES